MPVEVVMPRFSDTMEEGRILRWFKNEGDRVEKGEKLLELETDKAVMEMESYESGTLQKVLTKEGESAPVGAPIAIIEPAGKPAAVAAPAAPARAARPAKEEEVAARPEGIRERLPAGKEERIKVSPLARRMAEERGIELSAMKGTGPAGRITEKDVEAYLSFREERREVARPPTIAVAPPEEVEMVELSRMQQTIARRMSEIKATVPHFYLTNEIDMTETVRRRRFLNEAIKDAKITFNDIAVKAVALALKRFPNVNSFYRDGKFERHPWVNVGIAVAVEDGLLVPVLRDVDKKDLRTIARETAELIERTRAERLFPHDLEGGTFTVTNLGMYDVEEFGAIINSPQSAILAIGAIKRKPVVIDDDLEVRDRMRVTLACDHRIVYGAEGAQFVLEIKRLLENPLNLVV